MFGQTLIMGTVVALTGNGTGTIQLKEDSGINYVIKRVHFASTSNLFDLTAWTDAQQRSYFRTGFNATDYASGEVLTTGDSYITGIKLEPDAPIIVVGNVPHTISLKDRSGVANTVRGTFIGEELDNAGLKQRYPLQAAYLKITVQGG